MVPEMVGEQRVAAAVRADELADGAHEKQPADRVVRLAPDNQQPYRGAGNADDAAITPLATWCDSTLSGIAAAKVSSASRPSATAQARAALGSSLTNRTLRPERSGNVTAARFPR